MEREDFLQCVITSNIFNLAVRGGCKNVMNCKSIPLCEKCGHYIRPGVSFFGDMVDNALITKSIEEVKKTDLLLLLGTTLRSEVFHGFLEHFDGTTLAIIHEENDMADNHADLVIYAQPKDAFKELGYHMQ